MINFQSLLQLHIWGNSGREYLIALGVFIGALVVLKIFREFILHSFKRAAKKTKTDLDDVLIGIIHDVKPPFYFFTSLYIGINFLNLSSLIDRVVDSLFLIVIMLQVVKSLRIFIDYWVSKLVRKKDGDNVAQNKSAIKSAGSFLKIIIWVIAILLVLSNLGFDVTSLIAGLGIGGIAIAFALQNVLGDIFSSFSILIDKPFQIGDFIIVGSDMGTVEKIGIKSTRIKTLQGQELIVSNQELTSARVNNYKKMEKRRIVFGFGATYETSTEKLKKIPEMIKNIIDKEELADLDRVHFKDYGDFSLNFEVVYYVAVPDYTKYMDIQQSINFAIKQAFEEEGIEFAYPTQTLFVKK